MATKTGWAIVGNFGLYTDWHFVRREIIARHVADSELGEWPAFCLSGRLSDKQMEAWKKCQKRGDRAVKVRITYPAHVASKGA